MQLSVLDHSPLLAGQSPADAFRDTLELARLAEQLGYHRYWLAEHHGAGLYAGVAPEVLIARVASATSGIRVGSGGVLLGHYSPLKVAEVFRVLAALFPGRIDLGIGRALADPDTARALTYGAPTGPETFEPRLSSLLALLAGDARPEFPTPPPLDALPQVWSLGSGYQSALLAARHGLAFSYAHFLSPQTGAPATRGYRERFQPSRFHAAPRAALAVYVACAGTEDEARRLARCFDVVALDTRAARPPRSLPSRAEVEARRFAPEDLQHLESARRVVVGAPGRVRDQLLGLAAEFMVDELIVVTFCPDHRDRLRSYELLAEALHR